MGDVIPYRPKALVEFEFSAAKLVADSSRFMADVPAAIRVAARMGENDLVRRICDLIIPLSALVNSVGMLEEYAEEIHDAVPPGEPVIMTVENAGEAHNVRCHAEVRGPVIHINRFEL